MKANNTAAMLEALVKAKKAICHHAEYVCRSLAWENSNIQSNCADILCAHRDLCEAKTAIDATLSVAPHKGKWKNGTRYEYEYAYCSECGRMQWAGWDSHREAEDNIESFANDYKFCPGCGTEMEGGVYVKTNKG